LVPLYSSVAATHFDCAGAIREGRADVAMGLRAVAESCDLDFLPVQEVAFNLIIPRTLLDFAPVAKLLNLLQNRGFRRQLDGLPGYATRETGKLLPGA
jgi:molybdate-binding protein